MVAHGNFIVVTPARDEAEFLGQTIKSVLSQTLLPAQWVIVDDGSSDDTGQIAAEAARANSWIKVYTRPDRGHHDWGGGVVEAIYDGLAQVSISLYEYIFNIDGDIVLGKRYFEGMIEKFDANPKLGIAVGNLYDLVNGKLAKERGQTQGMGGAVKCWRRACFEHIGGLVPGESWDGIDCIQAIRHGWQTATFSDPDLLALHLRPWRGSFSLVCRNWARRGRALHFAGAHPLWVLAGALYHVASRPYLLGGLSLLIGYLNACLKGAKQFEDKKFRRFLRKWQLHKLAVILKLTEQCAN